VLDCFDVAFKYACAGRIHGIVYAPISIEAVVRIGRIKFRDPVTGSMDEMGLFVSKLGAVDNLYGELNVVEGLWTIRVTSHVPFAEVARHLTVESIAEAVKLLDMSLKAAGMECPHIAVSAINPHGGEGGLCGREEIEIIAPAVKAARSRGMNVAGPFPAERYSCGHEEVTMMR